MASIGFKMFQGIEGLEGVFNDKLRSTLEHLVTSKCNHQLSSLPSQCIACSRSSPWNQVDIEGICGEKVRLVVPLMIVASTQPKLDRFSE